jgi:hypothetical protein
VRRLESTNTFIFSYFFQAEKWFTNCGTRVTGSDLKFQNGKKKSNHSLGRGRSRTRTKRREKMKEEKVEEERR